MILTEQSFQAKLTIWLSSKQKQNLVQNRARLVIWSDQLNYLSSSTHQQQHSLVEENNTQNSLDFSHWFYLLSLLTSLKIFSLIFHLFLTTRGQEKVENHYLIPSWVPLVYTRHGDHKTAGILIHNNPLSRSLNPSFEEISSSHMT